MNNRLRLLPVTALTALLATGLTACGTTMVEGPEAAAQVKSKVLQPRGIESAQVKCPAETEAKVGAKVKCSVTGEQKSKGTVTASVVDEDGNLGKFKPDVDKVQLAVIEQNAQEEGRSKGVTGSVDCPSISEPKKGALYFCTADIRNSGPGVVLVTQTDEASNVSVRVQRRTLGTSKIERQIKSAVSKQGINARVTCPPKVTSQKGNKFNCTVVNPANGRRITVQVTQTDDEGNVSLKIK